MIPDVIIVIEHAVYDCDRWWRNRRELEVTIGTDISPETVVNRMLESRRNRVTINGFIDHILFTKEEDATQRQRNNIT